MLVGRWSVVWMAKNELGPWFDFHITIPRRSDMPPHDVFDFGLVLYRLSVWYVRKLRTEQEIKAKLESQGVDWDWWCREYGVGISAEDGEAT